MSTSKDQDVAAEESTRILTSVFRENDVYLGGAALGTGFRRAARYYLNSVAPAKLQRQIEEIPQGCKDEDAGAEDDVDLDAVPPEDSFYVLDLGVVVFQYSQWCHRFPRVQPFYAVKCNPDPVIIRTLAVLGSNFDCASREEIRLVLKMTADLPRKPDIIYANPCKARAHIVEAVRSGVSLMTFDNIDEVRKCASISKKIKLILRIITDDRGSTSRLSSKFGAPREHWRHLLRTAKESGLEVVGVSFHVGSGCHDASKYDLALKDAKEVFAMAKNDFGFEMKILDIGGGFPGETHSLLNPELRDPANEDDIEDDAEDEEDLAEEKKDNGVDNERSSPVMYFNEIADHVGPVLDTMFPESSGIQIIAEPGRYLVAACATLLVNVVAVRRNILDEKEKASPVSDEEAAKALAGLTREEEGEIIEGQGNPDVFLEVMKHVTWQSERFTRQALAQQEVDVYTDQVDFVHQMNESIGSLDLDEFDLGYIPSSPRNETQRKKAEKHTAEGVSSAIVNECFEDEEAEYSGGVAKSPDNKSDFHALAAAGEAAIAGAVMEAVATAIPVQDDFAYYVNDGLYGGFNSIMFDHAIVRPRLLRNPASANRRNKHKITSSLTAEGFKSLESFGGSDSDSDKDVNLYTSTIFGPTCDSIDVVARSVLLPKLEIGDWLYFNNMGAYTMAAASSFNGFAPTEKFYVCSVQPENFEKLII